MDYIKPRWASLFTDIVRPSGIALMFAVITILPLLFAILELGINGVGIRLATVMASYFTAIPEIFYTTLQVMFVGYIAGKSSEVVAGKLAARKPSTVSAEQADVTINEREAKG